MAAEGVVSDDDAANGTVRGLKKAADAQTDASPKAENPARRRTTRRAAKGAVGGTELRAPPLLWSVVLSVLAPAYKDVIVAMSPNPDRMQ